MPALDLLKRTRLNNGNLQGSARWRIEGVYITETHIIHMDADPGADALTPVNKPNPYIVGDWIWLKQSGADPLPGGIPNRAMYVVAVNGESIQISETQGGQPVNITSAGRVVVQPLLADYRQSTGEDILFGMKTDIINDLTEDQREEIISTVEQLLIGFKFENENP